MRKAWPAASWCRVFACRSPCEVRAYRSSLLVFMASRRARCASRPLPCVFCLQTGVFGHIDSAVLDRDCDGFQVVAEAGPTQALAIGDAEQRAVGGADEMVAIGREEATRDPIERRADMRTGVQVDEHRPALTKGEQAGEAAFRRWEALGPTVRDLLQ